MQRTGIAKLPLHYGKAPRWLTFRMKKLANEIVTIILDEYGTDSFLRRISDPFWFQALGCVLGYDWHSSGVTTVVTGVLKEAIVPAEHGIAVLGGKGKASRQTLVEIGTIGDKFGFSGHSIEVLRYASKMSAKVDNSAIQAGYQLYHHTFFVTENGKWAVVQQGMCLQDRTARRYHWLSDRTDNFVNEPHNAIVGDVRRQAVLNMTAKESENCRKTSVDVSKEPTEKIKRLLPPSPQQNQKSLREWLPQTVESAEKEHQISYLSMPASINWRTLKRIYEFQPRNYEELLGLKGVGPATIRGLALIADLVYGEEPSWRDPVKYSFAYGGKDGVPYPVERKAMDESIQILREAIQSADVDDREKLHTLERLRQYVPACF